MAKPLIFSFRGTNIECHLNKVDRSKLYGYKELEVFDENGMQCEMATLAEDGHTLIGKGGTGLGYLSADGLWCDKSQLRPVDIEGNPIVPVGSSFSAPVVLEDANLTTSDDYLFHTIRALYELESSEGNELEKIIRKGAIFKFPYSFRGGLEADVAFLLANESGAIFMAIGRPALIEFIGLQQVASIIEDEEFDEDPGDEMDFGMI